VLKIRRVSDTAVQQLLLDLTALKTVTLGLPNLGKAGTSGGGGGGGGKSSSASYVRLVNLESSKLESLLKVPIYIYICINIYILITIPCI
jgi:hypothetical protein